MALYARLTCYPPLGQVSVTELESNNNQVRFTCIIEASKSTQEFPWEVVLCYDQSHKSTHAWKWLECSMRNDALKGVSFHRQDNAIPGSLGECYLSSFSCTLTFPTTTPVAFTIKYRSDASSPWLWVKMQFGWEHGLLLLRQRSTHMSFSSRLSLKPDWHAESLRLDSTGVTVFQVKRSAITERTSKAFGKVCDQVSFLALVRIADPWLGPRHGDSVFYIEEDAMVVCFLTESGDVVTVLGVNGVLNSDTDGNITIIPHNDNLDGKQTLVVVAVDTNAELSLNAAVSGLRQLQEEAVDPSDNPTLTTIDVTQNRSWHDGLAYCTYNSLGLDLNPNKIFNALAELEKAGINVSTLIVDDNWQSVDGHEDDGVWQLHRAWNEFEANKKFFPDGLKKLSREVRCRFPRIKDIGVWHALFGYWRGLAPTGQLIEKYKTMKTKAVLMGHVTSDIYIIHPDVVHGFYNDFYTFLISCGITSVKTDVQFMLDNLIGNAEHDHINSAYQSAWYMAHTRHFNGRAISCMSMIPQILFNSSLLPNWAKVTLRNSDDYHPEIPNSHTIHVFTNAHNALLTRTLNVTPDWDMFQTVHPFATFHAAARCLSGGPIMITDTPGKHDVDLVNSMVAPNPRFGSIALRPTQGGRVMNPFNPLTKGAVLNIGASSYFETCGSSTSAHSATYLGVFNVSEQPITFAINTPIDFPQIEERLEHEECIVRSHCSSQVFDKTTELIHTILPVRGWEIFTKHQLHAIPRPSSSNSVAVLGLLGKMTGAAAILSYEILEDRLEISLKALGVLGLWFANDIAESLPTLRFRGNEEKVHTNWVRISSTLNITSGYVVEIDVLKAWDDYSQVANPNNSNDRGDSIDFEVFFYN